MKNAMITLTGVSNDLITESDLKNFMTYWVWGVQHTQTLIFLLKTVFLNKDSSTVIDKKISKLITVYLKARTKCTRDNMSSIQFQQENAQQKHFSSSTRKNQMTINVQAEMI